jgi:hypothetical protein
VQSIEDVVRSLVCSTEGQSFKGDDFRMLCRPCVYLFLKDALVLYVGMSRNGISRPAERGHRQAMLARAECDEVRIFPCLTIFAAQQLEGLLISGLQPKYNKRQRMPRFIARLMGVGQQAIRTRLGPR